MSRELLINYEIIQGAIMAFAQEQQNMIQLDEALGADVRSLIDSGWIGDSANAFGEKYYNDTEKRLKGFIDLLGRIGDALQAAMEEMQKADQQAAQIQNEG